MKFYISADNTKKYSVIKTRLFVSDLVLNIIFLVLFQFFLARPFAELLYSMGLNFYLSCFIFVSVFSLILYIAAFPLHFFSSFIIEHKFGLSEQNKRAWFSDELKSSVLSFVLFMVCVEAFYLIVRVFPLYWWIIAGAGWIFFTVVLARLLPVLLIPIFFKYSPIKDEDLLGRIKKMAEDAGVVLVDVCEIDFSRKTKKANAALVGLGSTRKVILADTLVDNFDHDEILSVVAHELGHFRYKHIWKLLFFSGAVTLAGFFLLFHLAGLISGMMGAGGISDLSIFPSLIFLLIVSGILLMPFQNFMSRTFERQADRYTLTVTGKPDSFISLMEKLSDMNLSERKPSLLKKIFLYDHPPIDERISMAGSFRKDPDNI